MKRFLCLLCALLMTAACAFAEPVLILPQEERMPVCAAIARDLTKVVKPEWFNASGIAKSTVGRHSDHTVIFADEARLEWTPTALYYNEYSGKSEVVYEDAENGKTYTELLPSPTTANAAASLAGWMTFGWPETGEIYPLEKERLTHIALSEAQARADQLFATLGLEGYVCETALDMSLARIREMGEKWNELIDRGIFVSTLRMNPGAATTQDEGYFLRYRRFGTESDLSGQFHADLYVTAEGFASVNICDQYAMGEVLSVPETLISWQEAAEALPGALADSHMQPELEEITVARLTWCPVREKASESGMAFTPAWVLAFTALSDGRSCEMHAVFNAVTGGLITGNWY